MKILYAASEAAPFIKTGGLADVAGSLPAALAQEGHDVRVILPLYDGIAQEWREQMTYLQNYYVQLSWRNLYCGLFLLEKDGVSYYFLDNEYYFRRGGVYGYYDDAERFAFFSRAVLKTAQMLDWAPDIIHANDWQTALIPIYLLEARGVFPVLQGTRSVFTIHNIEYQGRYGPELLDDVLGLSPGYLSPDILEYYGDVNLMKGAILTADYVTTVSPTYAEELCYPFYAHGLDGVIAANRHKMRGILNGIDTEAYNPAHDKRLAATFTAKDLKGKAQDKAALQAALGLRPAPDTPIVACVSRLVGHKGFELVTHIFHDMMRMEIQFVLLGTGEWGYEQFFRSMQNQYPGRVSANILYSGTLSANIYAGADLFLMPSVSEPCGLSQMIAMRYGTVPIVRETGGLKDSVPPCDMTKQVGLGYTFLTLNEGDLLGAVRRAVDGYRDKTGWKALMQRCMKADFSWKRSCQAYLDIYKMLTKQK